MEWETDRQEGGRQGVYSGCESGHTTPSPPRGTSCPAHQRLSLPIVPAVAVSSASRFSGYACAERAGVSRGGEG